MPAVRPLPLLWLPLLAVLAGCASPPERAGAPPRIEHALPEGPRPWTSRPPVDGAPHFKFAVVTDRTGEHRDGVFEAAIDQVNLLQPAFVVSVGDLVEGYSDDPAEIEAQWEEFDGFVARLDAPFFYAAGNHDYSNPAMSRAWRERRGPSFYHFRYRDVLFLVLNSELFPGVAAPEGIDGPEAQREQLAFAESVLDANRDARWTFVLIHRPLWDRGQVHPDWLAIEEWLGDRPYTVLAGHIHRYTHERRRDRRYVTLATTGGLSRLRGLDYGEFDHVALVSVGEGEPVIANLLLDGIHDVEVRTREVRRRLRGLERALTALPLRADAASFRSGSAGFEVRNEGDAPLRVEARTRAGRDLVPGVERLEAVVEPGGRRRLEVPVAAPDPGPPGAMAPATVHWTLVGERGDGRPLRVEQTSWLLPEAPFACPRVAGVEVDGRLDDWSALPFEIAARPAEGAEPAPDATSARFAVGHDDAFLYVAARVVDPTPQRSAERGPRDQDALQVVIDPRPAAERDANHGILRARNDGSLARMVFAWLLPGASRPDPIVGTLLPPLPAGSRRAARSTDTGYTAELAIPIGFLDAEQDGAWQGFRLNVSVQDFAAEGSGHAIFDWRPSRFGLRGVTPVEGSGSFRRTE